MSGRRRFICPNGFHRATRLCFRAFDAIMLMRSGASPIAQMPGAVSKDRRPSRLKHARGAGRSRLGAATARPRKKFDDVRRARGEPNRTASLRERLIAPMQQSGDWLDRTMSFVAGFLGTFFGLTFVWALIETLT